MTHLPPYIIEELRRIEEERMRQEEDDNRPRLYIPVPLPERFNYEYDETLDEQSSEHRGPVVVDITTGETLKS